MVWSQVDFPIDRDCEAPSGWDYAQPATTTDKTYKMLPVATPATMMATPVRTGPSPEIVVVCEIVVSSITAMLSPRSRSSSAVRNLLLDVAGG